MRGFEPKLGLEEVRKTEEIKTRPYMIVHCVRAYELALVKSKICSKL